jgi:TonB-linked SusC/RagA family outer membrane protein
MKYTLSVKRFRGLFLLIGIIAFCSPVFSQDGAGDVIRGKVTSDTSEELMSVMILEKDKTGRVFSNTQTDMNGDFSLKIKSEKNNLEFNYLGFTQQTVSIGTKRVFNITMKEENVLKEVVVTAQKSVSNGGLNIKAKEVSFAMQRINTKELEGIQVTSIDDALQGRISGLDIVGSGEVGKGASMRIRGTSSINANQEPLIVLNNIPFEVIIPENFDFATANEEQFANILNVNPEDIEEITVLKDAASTAIYGAKGANGVLMIKTKKGVTGPTRVNYVYRFTGGMQPKGMNMLSGDDYTMLMKQAYFNPYQNNVSSNIREYNYDRTFSEFRHYNNNTDWREEVIKYRTVNDQTITISGGGERAKFRIAGGYLNEQGSIIGQGLERYSLRSDLDYDVSNRITFTAEFNFTLSETDRNYDGLLDVAYKKLPNLSVYTKDDAGNDTDTYYNILQTSTLPDAQKDLRNPVAVANLASDRFTSYDIRPVLRLRYDFFDRELSDRYFRYEPYVSFQKKSEKTAKYLPREVLSVAYSDESVNKSYNNDNEQFIIQSDNRLSFGMTLNEMHSIGIMGAFRTTVANSNSQSITSYGFPNSLIKDPSALAYVLDMASGINESKSMNFLVNGHYSFKEKYILGFTLSREGSTKFGVGRKWGNFPGFSLRWNIADESFMDFSNDWLNIFSIRPSYGINGNSPGKDYLHFSIYNSWGNYAGLGTVRPENIRLTDLRWEKKEEFNIGSDLAFLEDKYTAELNFYSATVTDMLMADPKLPTSSGYGSLPYRNTGSMRNQGWDLNFRGNRFAKVGNVSFDFMFNIANNINTLLSLDQDILDTYNKDFTYQNGSYLQRMQENNAYGSIYGFRYKGVYEYNADSYDDPDIRAKVDAGTATMPVARNAEGQIIYDNKGVPLPMMYYYGPEGTAAENYFFQGGDAIYEDINHDGNIDELDIVYLGNSNPKFNGGTSLTFRWNNQLSATFFFNFRVGNKIINAARMNAENMYNDFNQSIATNWRWRKEGDQTEMPRALHQYGWNWLASDRFVEDGTFFRLKYITFNYGVPTEKIKKYGLKQLSAYLTINNLFCFSKYTGVDPEVGYGGLGISTDNSTTPRSRDFTLGINFGF